MYLKHFLTNSEARAAARDLFASYARADLLMTEISDAALDALATKYGTADIDDNDRAEAESLIDAYVARMDCTTQ